MMANSRIDLASVLSVDLILEGLGPYLPFPDIQNLAATSRRIRLVVQDNPSAYRRLDLSVVNGTLEHVFDAFIQSRKGLALLQHTRILILDGQSVDGDFLRNLLLSGDFQVRILSIIGVTDLDPQEWSSITQLLSHHAELIPEPRRLRGIHCFSPSGGWKADLSHPMARGVKAPSLVNYWYGEGGVILNEPSREQRMQVCATQGRLAWNAVLCRSPRHDDDHPAPLSPKLATFALGSKGCAHCGTLPEGPGSCPDELPLLDPPPFHGFSDRAIRGPPCDGKGAPMPFFARCMECVENRYCHQCRKFYCENCTQAMGRPLDTGQYLRSECSECDEVCGHCQKLNYRLCQGCNMLFCSIDHALRRGDVISDLIYTRPEHRSTVKENQLFWLQLCVECLGQSVLSLQADNPPSI